MLPSRENKEAPPNSLALPTNHPGAAGQARSEQATTGHERVPMIAVGDPRNRLQLDA